MNNKIDFLEGNITRLILKTCIPLMLASLVTVIIQIANTSFMGHDSLDSIYIISLFIPISFFLIAVTEALQISNQVNIARQKGKNNSVGISTHIINFLYLGLLASFLVGLIFYFTSPYIADYYQVNPSLKESFVNFVKWMMISNVLVIFTLLVSSSLRGYGKINSSVYFNVLYALTNISMVYIFTFTLEKGLFSIIYSNIISSTIFLFVGIILLKQNKIIVFKKESFFLSKEILSPIVSVGLPIFMSYSLIFISTLFFNKIVSPFGETTVAGFGIAYRIQTFTIFPALAIGIGLGIIMNHNLGANRYRRVYQVFRVGLLYTLMIYVALTVLLIYLKDNILLLMTNDAHALITAQDYLSIVAPTYLLFGGIILVLTVYEQINKGLIAVVLNVLYFVSIIVVSWYLTNSYKDISYFYWTIAGANGMGLIGITYSVYSLRKEFMNKEKTNMEAIFKGEQRMNLVKYSEKYNKEIYYLFTEEDFYFKTYTPHFLSCYDINGLVNEDTLLIFNANKLVGLIEFQEIMGPACHFKVHFRVNSKVELESASLYFDKIISAYKKYNRVVRLCAHCYDFDNWGNDFYSQNLFIKEGSLDNMIDMFESSIGINYYYKLDKDFEKKYSASVVRLENENDENRA